MNKSEVKIAVIENEIIIQIKSNIIITNKNVF